MLQKIGRLTGLGLVLGALAACGGGGGGGGSSGFSYDGATSQAQLNETNSQEFVDTTLDGSTGGDALVTRSSDSSSVTEETGIDLVGLGLALKDSVTLAGSRTSSTSPMTREIQSPPPETIEGACDGVVTIDITFDDQTGEFDGTIVYSNLDTCDVVIDGIARYSGVLNLADSTLESFTLNVDILSISDGTESVDLSGSITIDLPTMNVASIEYDLAFRTGGETFLLENFVISVDEGTTPESVTFNGRIYHPEHGFVDVSTNPAVPVQTSPFDGFPEAGEVTFTGQSSSATVTFTTMGFYTIDVDTDGDGNPNSTLTCDSSTLVCT